MRRRVVLQLCDVTLDDAMLYVARRRYTGQSDGRFSESRANINGPIMAK